VPACKVTVSQSLLVGCTRTSLSLSLFTLGSLLLLSPFFFLFSFFFLSHSSHLPFPSLSLSARPVAPDLLLLLLFYCQYQKLNICCWISSKSYFLSFFIFFSFPVRSFLDLARQRSLEFKINNSSPSDLRQVFSSPLSHRLSFLIQICFLTFSFINYSI
jgi:hypothetical protein